MNALLPMPVESEALSQDRSALAQRIATLVREREANRKALQIARARFDPPPRPAELTLNYRGPFGSIEIDVDGEELRERLQDLPPRSKRAHAMQTHKAVRRARCAG